MERQRQRTERRQRTKASGPSSQRRGVKVIDHASSFEQIVNPHALRARELRDMAIVVDFETTGAAGDDEVIQVGIVRASNGEILWDHKYRPDKPVSPLAWQIHKIGGQELRDKPKIAEHWEQISALLDGATVVAWNTSQDRRFLQQTIDRYSLPAPQIKEWACAMRLYQLFKGLPRACKLLVACEAMDVQPGTHRAVNYALAAARIIYAMARTVARDEVIVGQDKEPADEDLDPMAMTVRAFLCQRNDPAQAWIEKSTTAKDINEFGAEIEVIRYRYVDPLSGKELNLFEALEAQRKRL